MHFIGTDFSNFGHKLRIWSLIYNRRIFWHEKNVNLRSTEKLQQKSIENQI